MFSFFGFQFHLYGLIVGLAVVVTFQIIESQVTDPYLKRLWPKVSIGVMLGSLFGARLWHGMTDWQLYRENWIDLVALNQGGLSIIGALIGGLLTLIVSARLLALSWKQVVTLLDAAALALPVGQALGRVGNYFNQELYGLPTHLPWGIYIPPEKRVAAWQEFSFYHPLFAYEAGALLLFAGALWWLSASQPRWFPLGQGDRFKLYVLYYSGLRLVLDAVRVEKVTVLYGLGFNQVFLLFVLIGVVLSLVMSRKRWLYE